MYVMKYLIIFFFEEEGILVTEIGKRMPNMFDVTSFPKFKIA